MREFQHPTAATTGCWGRSLGTAVWDTAKLPYCQPAGAAARHREEDEFWKNDAHLKTNATCQPLNAAQINGTESWSSPR